MLAGGNPGSHKIQGIGAGFVPNVLDLDVVDEIIPVAHENAGDIARRLAKEEGIFAGPSSGANVHGALQLLKGPLKGKTVFVVLPDSGLKYLSTDLW